MNTEKKIKMFERPVPVQTECRVCHKPMTVMVVPSPQYEDGTDLVDFTPFLKMACCDACLVDMGYMRREQSRLPEMPVPYKD
jgi:hypothetical protein